MGAMFCILYQSFPGTPRQGSALDPICKNRSRSQDKILMYKVIFMRERERGRESESACMCFIDQDGFLKVLIIGTFRFAWTDTCDVHSRQCIKKDVDRSNPRCRCANLKVPNAKVLKPDSCKRLTTPPLQVHAGTLPLHNEKGSLLRVHSALCVYVCFVTPPPFFCC